MGLEEGLAWMGRAQVGPQAAIPWAFPQDPQTACGPPSRTAHLSLVPLLSIRSGDAGLHSLNPCLAQLFRVSLKHAASVKRVTCKPLRFLWAQAPARWLQRPSSPLPHPHLPYLKLDSCKNRMKTPWSVLVDRPSGVSYSLATCQS